MTSYRANTPLGSRDGLSGRERNELRKSGAAPPACGHHVIDMTGQTVAGFAVDRRVRNANGNACWAGTMVSCGHRAVFEGIRLRRAQKTGETLRCRECRKAKP